MNIFGTSLKRYYKYIIFLIAIVGVGIISGFIYFNVVKENIVIDLEKELLSMTFSNNNLVYHFIVLSILCFSTFLILGIVFGLFVYFYEAMSAGFVLGALFSYFGISGFIYGVLHVLIFKSVFIALFSLILIKIINLSKNIVGYFLLKKDSSIKDAAVSNFITLIKYCFFIILNDLFLVFFGNKIISIFSFLIEG